jgi:ribosome recycling factor
MYQEVIDSKKNDFEQAVESLTLEFGKTRTGRASASLVENILVESYGTKMPLKQLASIAVTDARTITVNPWDKKNISEIESALRKSDQGFNPANDGQLIRINLPPLTEERRKELVKVVSQKAEEARVLIRSTREAAWKEIQNLEQEGKISEDDKFRGKEKLQKIVDEYNEKIEEIRKRKEKEIMTV